MANTISDQLQQSFTIDGYHDEIEIEPEEKMEKRRVPAFILISRSHVEIQHRIISARRLGSSSSLNF